MFVWIIFFLLLFVVSINDFLFFRIEDEIVIALFILYGISCLLGESGGNFTNGIIAAVVVGIFSITLNRFNLIGGGDVKLLFPLVLFADGNLADFAIGTACSGFALSVIYIAFGRKIFFFRKCILREIEKTNKNGIKSFLLRSILLSYNKINKRIVESEVYTKETLKQEIPFGIALSCGSLYTVLCYLIAR